MRNILLYSGGPDSFIALRKLQRTYPVVETVHFNLRVRYGRQEKYAISQTAPMTTIDESLRSLGDLEDGSAYIPFRNVHLVFGVAKYFAEGDKGIVWLVVQKDEMELEDRSPAFFEGINFLFRGMRLPIDVRTPFIDIDKTAMVGSYIAEGGDPEELKKTWSCYRPVSTCDEQQREITDYVGCGDCPACLRRFIAFSVNGINEKYAVDPVKSETASAYRIRARERRYSAQRCQRILEALGEHDPDRTRYKGAGRALR